MPAAPALAAPESAESSATVTVNTGSGDLNVRSAPSATSQRVGSLRNGARITITCHARGTVFNGGPYDMSTDLWNRLAGGGYVTDAMLDTGSDGPVVATVRHRIDAPGRAAFDRRHRRQQPPLKKGRRCGVPWRSGTSPPVSGPIRRSTGPRATWPPQARRRAGPSSPNLGSRAGGDTARCAGRPGAGHVAWVDATSNRGAGLPADHRNGRDG